MGYFLALLLGLFASGPSSTTTPYHGPSCPIGQNLIEVPKPGRPPCHARTQNECLSTVFKCVSPTPPPAPIVPEDPLGVCDGA